MMRNKVAYWTCTALACICAVLPYYWTQLFGYGANIVTLEFALAVLWLTFFSATVYFAKELGWGRWWVALTAPLALFRAAESLLIFAIWKVRGFAP